MPLSEAYLQSRYTAGRWYLTGRALRPFCLDLLEQLEAIGSPCIQHGAPVTLDDLRIAATICSAPHGQGIRRIYQFTSWLYWRLIGRRIYSVSQEYDRWQAYLVDNYSTPQIWTKKSDTKARPLSTPWTLALEIKLVQAGYLSSQARRMPLGLAVWIGLALSEAAGGARPMTDEEQAIINQLEAMKTHV